MPSADCSPWSAFGGRSNRRVAKALRNYGVSRSARYLDTKLTYFTQVSSRSPLSRHFRYSSGSLKSWPVSSRQSTWPNLSRKRRTISIVRSRDSSSNSARSTPLWPSLMPMAMAPPLMAPHSAWLRPTPPPRGRAAQRTSSHGKSQDPCITCRTASAQLWAWPKISCALSAACSPLSRLATVTPPVI